MLSIASRIDMETARAFSKKAHHADCLDYLCLFRSELVTVKAYFFDHGSDDDVVVPHTHRYDFSTYVLAGSLTENRYHFDQGGDPYRQYVYFTPLDARSEGEAGFYPALSVPLTRTQQRYQAGSGYFNLAHRDIHTLTLVEPGTVLLLTQHADVGYYCTFAYSQGEAPKLVEGAYQPMPERDISRYIERLASLETACARP